jgi:hypothetical protein
MDSCLEGNIARFEVRTLLSGIREVLSELLSDDRYDFRSSRMSLGQHVFLIPLTERFVNG